MIIVEEHVGHSHLFSSSYDTTHLLIQIGRRRQCAYHNLNFPEEDRSPFATKDESEQ